MPTTAEPAAQPLGDLKIEISQSAGVIRVLDPRIFREDRRGWCRALADSAAGGRDVRSVRLDLETAAYEIQFVAQPSAHVMAGVLAESMRAADAPRPSRLALSPGLVCVAVTGTAGVDFPDRLCGGSLHVDLRLVDEGTQGDRDRAPLPVRIESRSQVAR